MVDSNKIKGRIVELGLNQHLVAKQMGISQCTLSQKISNARMFTLEEANTLQSILNIPDCDFKIYFFQQSKSNKT